MPKKRKYKKRKKDLLDYLVLPRIPSFDLDPDIKKSIFILIMIIIGALGLLGVFESAGIVGVYISIALEIAFGWGKFFIPIIIILLGVALFYEDRFILRASNYFGLLILILSSHTLMQLFVHRDSWYMSLDEGIGGGYLGLFIAENSIKFTGIYATWIIFVCLFIISLTLTFNTSLSKIIGKESIFIKLFLPLTFIIEKLSEMKINREMRRLEKEKEKEEEDVEEIELETEDMEDVDEDIEEEAEDDGDFLEGVGLEKEKTTEQPKFNTKAVPVPPSETKVASASLDESLWWKNSGINIDIPINILTGGKEKAKSGDIKANSEIIRSTLENFHIPVEMGAVAVGPTVTQYTFKPSEGVKLAKITGLGNDLALALAAHPIRIEAPIPGKSLVGVEVPNETKAVVTLRSILKSNEYKDRDNNLMVALGEDVSGKPWLYNLTKMPHLLVAGATNSGKSVCLNTIIVSLLYQNTPDDLRFIMVDPKRVELPIYDGIPYLLTPVITDIDKTVNALKWCLKEMDRRYEILQKKHKKNIQSYNEVAKDRMPYIVFVIDELADLMVIAAKDIEGAIIRLAQMARAVGIHLILATQRPSVDVITGLIKANMPSRIAFSVASGTDSRTILDSLGAEKLLGRGDMLFSTAEISKPVRIQGAYVSDADIKKIIHIIKKRGGETSYVGDVTDDHKVRGLGGSGSDSFSGDGDGDSRLEEAKEVVINDQKASASYLQRKLGLGYARAAKILDMLEDMGVVGPSNGSKPREILISKEQYENMLANGTSGVSLHSRDEAVAPDNYLGEDDDPVTALRSKNIEEDEEEEEDEEDENIDDEEGEDLTEEDKEDIDNEEEDEDSEEDEDGEEVDEEDEEDEEDEDEEDEEDEEINKDKDTKNKKPDNSVPFEKLFSK